ncbi:MAG TPA: HPr(Ser) kinase/phosphatase [Fibrobacteraceae bacterium]|nr:HPr(Ser) kinase/phosphatase [Fibrobacteraceae bacterium]
MRDFYTHFGTQFELDLKTPESTLHTAISEPDIHRPGLAFAGFTDVFARQSIQMVGTTEWSYLESIGPERRKEVFHKLANFECPLWVLCHGLLPHPEMLDMCTRQNIPLMVTRKNTVDFVRGVSHELESWFSPFVIVHASLVDVYGVGMLYIGASNVGKSECVLDLVERGHRLVADDSVRLVRQDNSIVGYCDSLVNHHMEIRGIGFIDIRSMFGIHAVRKVKKVEIVVELRPYSDQESYDRTGLDAQYEDLMGVKVPRVLIPVSPGKNITVVSEVIAMNTLVKLSGIDPAKEFDEAVKKAIEEKMKRGDRDDNIFWYRQISGFYE